MTRSMWRSALCAAAASLAASASMAQQPAAAPSAPPVRHGGLSEGVAAVVNDQVISTYDLSQRTRLLLVTSGVQPTQDAVQQLEQEALRSLIDEHLEVEEIKREEKEQKFSIMADDAEVDDDIQRIARSNHLTEAQLLKALSTAGVQAQTFKDQLRAQLSWEHWIQGRYGGSRMKIGQDQVSAVLRQIQDEAAKPQYEINEIFIDASRVGGQSAAMDGASQLIAQIKQGAPFAAVAHQFSSASTSANGGDAGWLSETQVPAELRPALEQMRPGQLSDPIAVHDGVYIVQLRDKRAGAGSDMVTLKQAAISLDPNAPDTSVDEAKRKLLDLKHQVTSCADFETKADRVQGVVAGDLGEADVKDLAPAFREAVASLQPGQLSDPVRTNAGLHLIALCARRPSGVDMPSREEIESRLEDQQLSLISRRYLRDLTNSATIDLR